MASNVIEQLVSSSREESFLDTEKREIRQNSYKRAQSDYDPRLKVAKLVRQHSLVLRLEVNGYRVN